METAEPDLVELMDRLTSLERRASARTTLERYLELCNVPRASLDLAELANLFTVDAIWEGVGPDYTGKFGRVEGRTAILAMLAGFLPPSLHFAKNIHLLGSGSTSAEAGTLSGKWMMQQISTYIDHTTELLVARLAVDFDVSAGATRMCHFRTEKLFVADLTTPIPAN